MCAILTSIQAGSIIIDYYDLRVTSQKDCMLKDLEAHHPLKILNVLSLKEFRIMVCY